MFREAFVSGLLALTLTCSTVLAQTEPVPPPAATEQGPAPGAQGGPPSGGPDSAGGPMGGPDQSMGPGGGGPMGGPMMDGMSRRGGSRAIIRMCRANVAASGLMGHQRRMAVISCVRARRPQLAQRMICRQHGRRLGLYPHTARMHAFVRRCVSHA